MRLLIAVSFRQAISKARMANLRREIARRSWRSTLSNCSSSCSAGNGRRMSQCRSPGSAIPAEGWVSHDVIGASASDAVRGRSNTRGFARSSKKPRATRNELNQGPTTRLPAKIGSSRADPRADDRRKAAGLRLRGSPMYRAFHLLDEFSDIVER